MVALDYNYTPSPTDTLVLGGYGYFRWGLGATPGLRLQSMICTVKNTTDNSPDLRDILPALQQQGLCGGAPCVPPVVGEGDILPPTVTRLRVYPLASPKSPTPAFLPDAVILNTTVDNAYLRVVLDVEDDYTGAISCRVKLVVDHPPTNLDNLVSSFDLDLVRVDNDVPMATAVRSLVGTITLPARRVLPGYLHLNFTTCHDSLYRRRTYDAEEIVSGSTSINISQSIQQIGEVDTAAPMDFVATDILDMKTIDTTSQSVDVEFVIGKGPNSTGEFFSAGI